MRTSVGVANVSYACTALSEYAVFKHAGLIPSGVA